jgi:hypothetical protein
MNVAGTRSRNTFARSLALASAVAFVAAAGGCSRDLAAPRADVQSVDKSVPRTASADKRDGGPTLLAAAADAPTIANPVITFWAIKGVDQRVKMVYHRRSSGGNAQGGSAASANSTASGSRHGDDAGRGNGSSGGRDDGGNGATGGGNGGSGRDSVVFAEFRVRPRSLAFRPDGSAIADGDSVLITMTLVDALHGIIEFQPSGLRFSADDPASLKISFENSNLDLNGDGVVDARDRAIQETFHIAVRERPADPFLSLPSSVSAELDEVEAALLGFSGYAIAF